MSRNAPAARNCRPMGLSGAVAALSRPVCRAPCALCHPVRRPQDGARVTMRPACLAHPVEVRIASTDLETYHQVLVEQQHAVVGEMDPEIIVDCGANAGYASAWMLNRALRRQCRGLPAQPCTFWRPGDDPPRGGL